ncbi:MAG: tetratricopeptide repeat protein [Chloroflexota bacterium]
MRIQRDRSNLTFRKRRRRRGCVPLTLLLGLLIGGVFVSWNWLGLRLVFFPPPATSADLRSAQRAFDAGEIDTAIAQARELWQSNPNQVEALRLLARALVYRSYYDWNRAVDRSTALAFTSEAYARMPGDPAVMAAHAFTLQANGRPADAARIANQALRINPREQLARVARALAYGRVGGYENALRESEAALALGESLDARRALAISLSDMGRYQEAIATIEDAVAGHNRLLTLHFELALYAMQIGDADTATAAYFSVLAFDPENIKARLRMCELSSTLRETDTALAYCSEVVERAPTWADGWYRLGREHFLNGSFAAAQNSLNRCSTLQTLHDVPMEDRIFDCWYLQGQAAEILGDCESLLKIYSEYQAMMQSANLPQTWTYPPEGPSICIDPASVGSS